jgi:hypothetical protein
VLSQSVASRLLGAQLEISRDAVNQGELREPKAHEELVRQQGDAWALVYWIEVPLRNVIHTELAEKFGTRWWYSRDFQLKVGSSLASEALKSRRARSNSKFFLDDLSFGFWVRLLQPSLEQRLWVPILRKAFVEGVSRKQLHNDLLKFKAHRNSLAHHELRNTLHLAEMHVLAMRIAACIDDELLSLIGGL